MASRWKKHRDENLSTSHSSDPPPLNENCARYILNVMTSYLRQTSTSEQGLLHKANFTVDSCFRDYELLDVTSNEALDTQIDTSLSDFSLPEWATPSSSSHVPASPVSSGEGHSLSLPIPPGSWIYEKSHGSQIKSQSSMNNLIRKFTGRIVYHLSASNWGVVLAKLRNKIHYLAHTTDDKPDIVDMGLMIHSALDRSRLVQVLNGAFCRVFIFFPITNRSLRAFFLAPEHEKGSPNIPRSTSLRCHLELDRNLSDRVQRYSPLQGPDGGGS